MQLLTAASFQAFVEAKPAAAIHFDAAAWDSYRDLTHKKMLEAEAVLGEQAGFGEVDIDSEPELSKSIPVLNVPLVAYYLSGKLVAALIGAGQDVRARLERILRGESIGYGDGTDASLPRDKVKHGR